MPRARPSPTRQLGTSRPARRRIPRSILSCAASLALLGAVAGCAQPGPTASAVPEGLPDGVTVAFVQLRSDVAARQAQVQVRNDTDEAIEVGDVAVTDPRFDGDAVRAVAGRTSVVGPKSTVDIRIQLPPMSCDTSEGGMTVVLGLADGVVEGPLPDDLDVIAPLHERECLAQRVADAATLAFAAFTPSPPGEAARLDLSIVPTGAGEAVIGGIQTTNLLTFSTAAGDTADTLAIDLAVDETGGTETVVPLPLIPLRCDPHAVQEDKRGTVFTIEVEVDGVPGQIELAAPEDMRGRILTWVGQWCGFGG